MKKFFLFLITSLLLLSGCSKNVNNPYELAKGTSTLSYYDTEDSINIDGFNVVENNLQNYQDKNNNILVNDDGIIRCITITDTAVKTYKGISVGDSVDRIEDAFDYESKLNDYYTVLFNGNIEENLENRNLEDNWIWINYLTDDFQIIAIQIFDVKYGRVLQ